MRLQQQDPLICRLIRDGMEVVAKHALVTHAWPDIDSGTAFRSDILQQVTKSHRASDPRVDDIIERVKVDADFAKQLGAAVSSSLILFLMNSHPLIFLRWFHVSRLYDHLSR